MVTLSAVITALINWATFGWFSFHIFRSHGDLASSETHLQPTESHSHRCRWYSRSRSFCTISNVTDNGQRQQRNVGVEVILDFDGIAQRNKGFFPNSMTASINAVVVAASGAIHFMGLLADNRSTPVPRWWPVASTPWQMLIECLFHCRFCCRSVAGWMTPIHRLCSEATIASANRFERMALL